MEKPELDTVLQTLAILYKDVPDDPLHQNAASKWLTHLQSSVYAWDIAHQLLSLDTDMKYHYFAAQTMQTKVRYFFDELPAEMHLTIRDSILTHLSNRSNIVSPITKQLALALSDLALQMTGWETIVEDCITKFGNNVSTIPILLDVLMVLPEEIGNRALRLGANQRQKWKQIFGGQCGGVLQLLSSCLGYWPNDEEIKTRVFSCLGSWICLGTFPVEEVAASPLIIAPFQALHPVKVSEKLYEAAADCICSALYICEDLTEFGPLAATLQHQVNQLLPIYIASIETEDTDRANALARIFTEMAESFIFHIVHYPDTPYGNINTFDLLIHCVQHYDYEIAEMTFNVWYRLSEMLTKLNDPQTEQRFRPYVAQFITSLVKHCQLNDDLGQDELPDDKDEFGEFRCHVVEVVRDVVFIVGSVECFESLYATLCTPGHLWVVTEASIFLMHAVAPSIDKNESRVLPIAVPVLLSIPRDAYYVIRCTTLRLIRELAHWIGQHPDTLNDVLRFIQDGFGIPCLASFAANAVQNICHKCKGQLAHLFDGLVAIVQSAESLGMTNNAVIGLMTGSVEVLEGLPGDKITSGMHSLCLMSARKLNELLQNDVSVQPHTLTDPALWMDRLAAVFRACEYKVKDGETHPGFHTAKELWPLLCTTIEKHKADQRIVERSCRCIRFILRCLKSHAVHLLTSLVTMSITVYQEHKHSCFLYLGSIIADEFGSDPNCQQGLMSMIEAFSEVTFPLLSGPSGLVQYPDTVDDMFRLCARMVQRCPLSFLASPVASTALECAKAASLHMHREAFSSVMKFFRDLIHCPFDEAFFGAGHDSINVAVQGILSENGQTLVSNLVLGFVTLQIYMLAESTAVLWELLTNYKEPTLRWLETALTQLQQERTNKMTDPQKMTILQSIQQTRSSDALEDIARELARLFR